MTTVASSGTGSLSTRKKRGGPTCRPLRMVTSTSAVISRERVPMTASADPGFQGRQFDLQEADPAPGGGKFVHRAIDPSAVGQGRGAQPVAEVVAGRVHVPERVRLKTIVHDGTDR